MTISATFGKIWQHAAMSETLAVERVLLSLYTFFTMSDTTKMFQAILNGQKALEERLTNKIDKVDLKVDKLDEKLDGVEKRLTKRIDKLGRQLSYLEDDTPTREEHDKLEKRVERLEQKTVLTA